MFAVGDTVAGKYRIERELGRGGMGVVVAATHLQLGTAVALKVLNEADADASMLARFMREARASAQLHSGHVCRVLDYGMEGATPYIVMELLEGSDLAQLVREAPLDSATAAELVIQACLGLAEAHAAQIVHRDLKPSNLFLTHLPDGSPLVKVVDFGVAKAPKGLDATLTQTQTVIGSPGFMSPEQLRSSRTVDGRTDIWALGVTLYKLTSRRMPFKAESLTELSVQIAMDPPQPLPEVPPAFERVVMRCLEKDPANRYQDVMELVAALSPLTGQGPRDTTPMVAPAAAPVPFELVRPRDLAALAAAAAAPPRAVSAQLTVPQRPGARPVASPHLVTTQRPPEPHEASTLGKASAQMLTPRPSRTRRSWWVAAGVISIAIGGVLGVAVSSSSSSTTSPPAAAVVPATAPVATKPVTPLPPPPVEPPPADPDKMLLAPKAVVKPKPRPDHHTDKSIKPPTDLKKQIGSSRI